jgi:localization factor PodJL
VKGIDPKAREVAKDLARRSGMTLGEWLNSMIMEDEDEGYATLPRRSAGPEMFERRGRSRRLDDAYDASDEGWQRVSASIDAIAARLEAAERRSTVAIQGVDQAVSGQGQIGQRRNPLPAVQQQSDLRSLKLEHFLQVV